MQTMILDIFDAEKMLTSPWLFSDVILRTLLLMSGQH